MQCKLCKFSHSSREVLLKHYRLRHYQGRSWQHPCLYTDCVCTFKTVGALKTHLTRSHKHTAALNDHFNFSCELCDFKDVCQPSQFLNHIRNHLRRHDTVSCPFKDCELTTNVLSTFSSHISRKHKSQGFEDFSSSVTLRTDRLESNEETGSEESTDPMQNLQSNVSDVTVPAVPSEHETNVYLEPVEYRSLEHKLASLILYMQTILHVSKSAIQEILSWMCDIVSLSRYTAKQSIRDILRKYESHIDESLAEELAELLSAEVLKTNPVFTATAKKGTLSTEYRWNAYFKEHFQVIDPVEYRFDRLHQNSFVYVPVLKVLEVLLNRADVLEKAVFVEEDLPGQYTSTRSGKYYKENQLLGVQSDCISMSMYTDEFEVCNPLGTSKKIHKITAVYWVLLNLPAKFRSTLSSIQLAMLGKSSDIKQFGYDKFFDPLLKDMKDLEQKGVFVEALNAHLRGTVYCVCADNLGAHSLGGFQESFQAENLCRFCQVSKDDIQTQYASCFQLRTVEQHNSITNELRDHHELQSRLGVKKECVLSKHLSFFHPITGFPPDVLHDTLEGIVPSELSVCLKELITKKYFTLDTLNKCIKSFPYKDSDRVNRPQVISRSSFSKKTIGGNGHENWALLRLLPLLIGNLVPNSEPAWEILMDLREIVELVMSVKFSEAMLCFLERKIVEHRQLLQDTFPNLKLRPKHHYVEHYPHLIRCFGPLVELWTFRFEAKHSYFKGVVRDVHNFKNIPLTLATKHQLMMAHYLNGPSLFSSPLSVQKVKTVRTCTLEELQKTAVRKKYPHKEVLSLASDVHLHGIHFSEGMILSSGQCSGLPDFFRILSVLANANKVAFLCKRLSSWYIEHYRRYEFSETSAIEILEPDDLNDPHPLTSYTVQGRNMIALKRFLLH